MDVGCPDCGNYEFQDLYHEDDTVCLQCGLVVCNQAFVERPESQKKSDSAYWAGVLAAAKAEAAAFPKGHTYQAVFHYNERLAQLDCYDPDIPRPIMEQIYRIHFSRVHGANGKTYVKQPFTREFIEDEILSHVVWPEEMRRNKKGNIRRKTPLQTFSERWIRIRFELTGLRPPKMDKWFRLRMQELFKLIAYVWPTVRHDPLCTYDLTGRCSNQEESKIFVCRHNLPHFNWMTQQLICHLLHQQPDIYGYSDAYIDYLPAIETAKRLELLKQQWLRLYKYTKIPYYTIRPLRTIPALE